VVDAEFPKRRRVYCVLYMMEEGRVSGQFAVVMCVGFADRPRVINRYLAF
jgi:hypothetical protein